MTEDDTAAETGAGCGNLVARIPGPPGARTVMLCAHLDTVPVADRIEVELEDGVYRNRREAILGADDKAGVAVLVELARRLTERGAPAGCELVFTTGEEVGLRGARAFDVGALGAEFGFVLDHAAPLGRMVVAAPTYYHVHAEFLGRSAHAGHQPRGRAQRDRGRGRGDRRDAARAHRRRDDGERGRDPRRATRRTSSPRAA